MSSTNAAQETLELVPMDLSNEQEIQELLKQRKICGWRYLSEDVDGWREMMAEGTKSLFWMTLPSKNSIRAGHISLASQSIPPHPQIARLDKTIMTISTFFTMPEYRGLGLGSQAIIMLEKLAKTPPHGSEQCEALVVDTMRKADDTPEFRAFFRERNLEPPQNFEEFYARRGYVKFHEEKRYEDSIPGIDPEDVDVKAAFMRKVLT